MGTALAVAWDALRFDASAVCRWSARRTALAWGLALLALVSLLGGLADGAAHAQACLHRPPSGAAERQRVEALASWLARTPLPVDAQSALAADVAALLELQGELAALPRPSGRDASCALQGLQRAAAAPYRRLAAWLPYTLAVFAVARALGSRAGLAQTLAASSLYALPHLLDVLRVAPGWGTLAGVVLLLWGAAIYLLAVAAVTRLGGARALLAVGLPGAAAVTLAVVLLAATTVVYHFGS